LEESTIELGNAILLRHRSTYRIRFDKDAKERERQQPGYATAQFANELRNRWMLSENAAPEDFPTLRFGRTRTRARVVTGVAIATPDERASADEAGPPAEEGTSLPHAHPTEHADMQPERRADSSALEEAVESSVKRRFEEAAAVENVAAEGFQQSPIVHAPRPIGRIDGKESRNVHDPSLAGGPVPPEILARSRHDTRVSGATDHPAETAASVTSQEPTQSVPSTELNASSHPPLYFREHEASAPSGSSAAAEIDRPRIQHTASRIEAAKATDVPANPIPAAASSGNSPRRHSTQNDVSVPTSRLVTSEPLPPLESFDGNLRADFVHEPLFPVYARWPRPPRPTSSYSEVPALEPAVLPQDAASRNYVRTSETVVADAPVPAALAGIMHHGTPTPSVASANVPVPHSESPTLAHAATEVFGAQAPVRQNGTHADAEEIAAQVLRIFARDMALEAERRGVVAWDY
jgi:hypothetical protein